MSNTNNATNRFEKITDSSGTYSKFQKRLTTAYAYIYRGVYNGTYNPAGGAPSN